MGTRKPAGQKVIVNARLDIGDVAKLDELGTREGTMQFQRSRSELIGFAVREYLDRHYPQPKPRPADRK